MAFFIAATAGNRGKTVVIRGGLAIAGPFAVPNGYINAVVPTDERVVPADLLDDAAMFFSTDQRSYVVWVPAGDTALFVEAARRGGVRKDNESPAMVIRTAIPASNRSTALTCTVVTTDEQADVVGMIAERGYELPGMARLMAAQGNCRAPGTTWTIVSDARDPLGVACGFINGETGGVYYVATPPEHRGQGVGAAATTHVVNALFAQGAQVVTLQASDAGFPVYRRLGFQEYGRYARFTFQFSTTT